ncbi:MAG: prephenate dehydratase [Treponema sp.]|nr:prephenate dehydratase [Candidatus Treponema equi]
MACDNKKPLVAYCGKPGCNAEAAVIGYFKESAESVPVDSFPEIFQKVTEGNVDYGMVPIENSLGGSVYQNYDNFRKYSDVYISGAIAIKISYCLLAVKGAKIEDLKKVYSHPQALLQTSGFLGNHKDWQQIEAYNTSGAALFVSETGSKENAAVASEINATIYNLDILAKGIEDDPNNYTRFVVISKERKTVENAHMASFMFKAKHEPGSLYKILGVLNDFGTNLTRLESRPIPGRPWEYQFYADVDLKTVEGQPEEHVKKINEKLKEKAEEVRLLGVYSEMGR